MSSSDIAKTFWKGTVPVIIRACIVAVIPALMITLFLSGNSFSQDDDAAVQFYVGNVGYVLDRNYLFNSDADFSFRARAILRTTDYRGKLKTIDTALYAVAWRSGEVYSVESLDSADTGKVALPDSFLFLQPWRMDYSFYFFPNDTGSGRMAIGFEAGGPGKDSLPAGFFNINRDDFYLQSLFLHSRDVRGYEGLSKTYFFERSGKMILPVRLEESAVKAAFLGRRYTRYIVEFYDYLIE
jgi:hypothetical protein